jgi:hypothetical protein
LRGSGIDRDVEHGLFKKRLLGAASEFDEKTIARAGAAAAFVTLYGPEG